MLYIIFAAIIIILFFLMYILQGIYKRKMQLWLPAYFKQKSIDFFKKNTSLPERHLIFCICDHFDLGSRGEFVEGEEKILDEWETKFPAFSEKHKDSEGINLKHTWFFPFHYHRSNYLERLVGICKKGCGEIEMHLHHDHHPPYIDTSDTLRKKIKDCVSEYAKHGVFCLPDGRKTFAFIHGDWALDNSRSGKYCGVNDEIKILSEEGCYADFTFPSPYHESQPQKINSIYYATDDPERPKSYNYGIDVEVGGKPCGDLMMIQGPLGIKYSKKYGIIPIPSTEGAEVEHNNYPTLFRVKTWIDCNVHVKGRPEWIFIKLHTHGAFKANYSHNFGQLAERFFTDLEDHYAKDEKTFIHYVTAREMFNIIKAAETGLDGNPTRFRDFFIPPYIYL